MSTLQDNEQNRAGFVYQCAQQVVALRSVEERIEYRNSLGDLPGMIREKGLSRTLDFLHQKVKQYPNSERIEQNCVYNDFIFKESTSFSTYQLIYLQIFFWLRTSLTHVIPRWDINNVVNQILKLNTYHYRQVTGEIISLLSWLVSYTTNLVDDEKF